MQTSGSLNTGVYREGDSFLHRLDPRLKLLLLPALIACLFSATSPLRLLLIFLLWVVAAAGLNAISSGMRVINLMKWLLLFTLLLHLFFTPGRTLLGTEWLSYDGLLRGLIVDSQVLLALLFSLLLSWTTRPTELAWGLARLLSPLERLRLPVQETGGLLLLVLHFFPVIQEELSGLRREQPLPVTGRLKRIRQSVTLIEPLLFRLLERADHLACQVAAGENPLQIKESPTDSRFRRSDLLWMVVASAVLAGLWML